jgi:Fe2+ transport system protein FeoA
MTDTAWASLSDVKTGRRAVVRQLRGGREFAGRLAALGFTIGVEITVIQNYGRGPITVLIRNTRIALGRGEASKVLVNAMSNQ